MVKEKILLGCFGNKEKEYKQYLKDIITNNTNDDTVFVEPFCGSAIISKSLHDEGNIKQYHINDIDTCRIDFYKNTDPSIRYLSTNIFKQLNIYLLYTGVLRSSTNILESIDIDKSIPLLQDVEDLEIAINNCDIEKFGNVINRGWENKKATSNLICGSPALLELDNKLKNDSNILAHKLCGAGNGGYFLIFTNFNSGFDPTKYDMLKSISISETGLKYINLKNEFTKL
jgi:hypothetical protein